MAKIKNNKIFSILVSTVLFFMVSGFLRAQNTDADNINKAIEKYIVGWRTANVDILKETFDLEAGVVLWVDKKGESEKLRSMTLLDLAEGVILQEDYGIGFEILSLDVVDSQIAMAKVKIPIPHERSYYIDFLQLQKINGIWKIALKSFVYFPTN